MLREVQYLFFVGKHGGQRTGEGDHDDAAQDGDADGKDLRVPNALAGPVDFPRAVVLAHEGGGGHGDGLHGDQGKGVQLVVAGPARHAGRAEEVDIALYEYVGEGSDSLLNAAGQTDGDDPLKGGKINAQPVQ